MATNILDTISRRMPDMRRSERKVAEFVLKYSDEVIHMRIVDLASETHVSEPTVVRFCRAISCDGFQSFKLQLAQLLAARPAYSPFNVPANASTAEYCESVFETTVNTLTAVSKDLDYGAIEKAASCLSHARRVEFYGLGSSSPVAIDAQHKFFRLQIASAAYSDPHLQVLSAMTLGEEDLVVAISQSGCTQSLIDVMQQVKDSGATLISIAPGHTPVSEAADIPIYVDVQQYNEETFTPLPSRIVHMAVIDVLALGVSKIKGPELEDHLRKVGKGLQSLRQDNH